MTTLPPESIHNARLGMPRLIGEQSWPEQTSPLVSILCITYNHEKYIEECLEGFLKQETTFPVEIIIQDDASTDSTAEIIRKFSSRHPTLFRPIFHETNQYSQGLKPTLLAARHARGSFVALCEGDDYWIDSGKLEHQITEMLKHPTCSMSFHPVIAEYHDRSRPEEVIGWLGKDDMLMEVESIIRTGSRFGSNCPTPSLVIKRNVFDQLPSWIVSAPVGDYYIKIFAALPGGALYINKTMAVYRAFTADSWSDRIKEKQVLISFLIATLDALYKANISTEKRHEKAFTSEMLVRLAKLQELLETTAADDVASSSQPLEKAAVMSINALSPRVRLGRLRRRIAKFGLSPLLFHILGSRLLSVSETLRNAAKRMLSKTIE